MVKEEEIIMEAGGRSYMEILGLGEDYFRCMSPSSYFASSVVSTATTSATPAAASPTCASYLDLPPPYHHHMLSFSGQEMCHGDGLFGFQHHGGDRAIPVAVPLPQKTSPTNECSSSISSMSSSPTATAVSAISCAKPQAFKKKGSRAGDQRKVAPDTAANKRPRVRREKLGERILALQQLVSPFGKTDTASVLHEALGYIRFLHDQVQVLSSPYMQRLPPSAHVTGQVSAAGVAAAEHRPADLRSRGLCLVPISCTEHVAGNGGRSSADMWSMAAEMANAAAGSKVAAAATTMRGDHLA
ncbi:hypothetical protein ACP70R_025472 [Stipagrostis hirtigluma subsp. patula]